MVPKAKDEKDFKKIKNFFSPVNKKINISERKSVQLLYNLPKLREMAKKEGIKGYYKMKKPELCKILNII
jgi:hypothetical protein